VMTQQQQDLGLAVAEWLTAKALAAHFGLNEESAYRWHSEGMIPREMIRYCGTRRIRFDPKAKKWLEEKFALGRRADGGWLDAKALARHFGLNEESAYRWRKKGLIAKKLIRNRGTRRIEFHPDAIRELERKFEAARA
jgi:predicted site-specific integrase-resolvase